VEVFVYLGTTLTIANSLQEEVTEQIVVKECLLSFGAEYFVFHFSIQRYKNQYMQSYNFAFCFVWV
jgi:hypothetical protein